MIDHGVTGFIVESVDEAGTTGAVPSMPAPSSGSVAPSNNGTNIDFMNADGDITPQHYAFLVSEAEFDEIFDRARERSLPYWADPAQTQADEINHHDRGRGSNRLPATLTWARFLAPAKLQVKDF